MKIKISFTLAEVLITLVVVGIIAAITVPVIVNNIKKDRLITQTKATYSIIRNGIKLAMAKDGVNSFEDTSIIQNITQSSTSYDAKAFRNEINKIFSTTKSFYGKSVATADRIQYKNLGGAGTFTIPNSASAGWAHNQTFYLHNGAILYMIGWKDGRLYIMFDVNGEAKPNELGRDLFNVAVDKDGTVEPSTAYSSKPNYCNPSIKGGSYSYGSSCLSRIMQEGWKMNY